MDFDKAFDRVDWTFISKMLQCLGFGPNCVAMVHTLFSNTSAFVSMNSTMTNHIPPYCSIRQGCPLAPHLYVLVVDALGYSLESARIQERIQGISLLDESEMMNNHFVDDSLLSLPLDQNSMDATRSCLDIFCSAFGSMVSKHKINY